MIETFKNLIEDAGGYAHPDLKLLVGAEAEHGLISLAGVTNDQLSAVVPYRLGEHRRKEGLWIKFLRELGYSINGLFWNQHNFGQGVMPLIGAANHSNDGGHLEELDDCYQLYGTTFVYSLDKKLLGRVWGINGN